MATWRICSASREVELRESVAMLLNYSPRSWCTRDDMLLAVCQRLSSRGIMPVLVTSEIGPEPWRRRFEALGVKLEALNYERGPVRYWRGLRRVIRQYSICTVHVRYFTAHS